MGKGWSRGVTVRAGSPCEQGPLESRTWPLSMVTLFSKPQPHPMARYQSSLFINFCQKLYKVMESESHQVTFNNNYTLLLRI